MIVSIQYSVIVSIQYWVCEFGRVERWTGALEWTTELVYVCTYA